ncbi:sigma-70 family RNA polymerase sigma factor [Kineosporia mesophila]|uniref:Sigma-70 family RNA polymerase sigma factor n=1 Tax=Kineosporia mesophila TaxID=566012 RepID=A0ABP7ACX4_9ACTN|nr:sigma-70 family RNA polymerase sigma factor [Kineosporia mesophila]MCD5352735.1 sigma-70 family RNA polymerase sigma factor [Kineosporia mesophila]
MSVPAGGSVARDPSELVLAAQAGDVAALGTLLAEHRPAMLAVALSFLSEPADAEDAVQDAALIALTRIGDLRDPRAVGPWLKMIVRNGCRMRLRARPPVGGMPDLAADPESDPARLIERHVARDWIWHALDQLSPPLRVVVLLRYFTRTTGYEQIAALCGVPVGTVRSRLSKARATLAGLLLATGESRYQGPDLETWQRYRELFSDLAGGTRSMAGLHQELHPRMETVWDSTRRTVGLEPVVGLIDRSAGAGVGLRVVNLVAGRDIVVCETQTLNPAENPDHCPPGVAWLLRLENGRADQLRLFHEPRGKTA